jgi:hypothetical protein
VAAHDRNETFDPGPTYVGGNGLRALFVIPKERQR